MALLATISLRPSQPCHVQESLLKVSLTQGLAGPGRLEPSLAQCQWVHTHVLPNNSTLHRQG